MKCRLIRIGMAISLLYCTDSSVPKALATDADEDIFLTFRASESRSKHRFASSFFVKQSQLSVQSKWDLGDSAVPLNIGAQALRCQSLLSLMGVTNAITLEQIDFNPIRSGNVHSSNMTPWFVLFEFRIQPTFEPKWVAMLLDGTLADERVEASGSMGQLPVGQSAGRNLAQTNVYPLLVSPSRSPKRVSHGSPTDFLLPGFHIPGIQWNHLVEDQFPANFCAQHHQARSFLLDQNPSLSALQIECVTLKHYFPGMSVNAHGLEANANMHHWQTVFRFGVTNLSRSFEVPVLLDNRVLGYWEFTDEQDLRAR